MGRALGVLGLGLILACSKTPPEPMPAASVTSVPSVPMETGASAKPAEHKLSADAALALAGRCITPLAPAAPKVPPPAGKACPPDPEPGKKPLVDAVTFPDTAGTPRVDVEIVRTEHDVERGLMYRPTMPEDHGMLFHLDARRDHTFWMHNTCISLDIMYIDDDGMIVGVAEAAPTLSDDVVSVGCPSVYVLEVNGGYVRRHGVKPGQKITIPQAAR